MTTYANQRDYYAVQAFLSASCDGPFIALLNRLTDPHPLYAYPASQLPHVGQNVAVGGGQVEDIYLNAFEFYFYHFFNLPLRHQNMYQGIINQGGNVPTDYLYPVLVEDYLSAFLPVEPHTQAKLFSQKNINVTQNDFSI